MGTAVDDEFPSTEMPTATNHQKEISSEGVLRDTWTLKLTLRNTLVSLHRHSSWSPHVNATAKKANGTRVFLQRNLRKAPTAVKTRTYESLICPILEYSGVVWDPHNAQDVNKPEMVQHRYARYTSRDYGRTSSVTAILKTLGWEPLAERHAKARITMMYRIVHGLVDILASDHIIQAPASRRNGNAQFRVPARNLPRRHAPVERHPK